MRKIIENYGQHIGVKLENEHGEIIAQPDFNFVDVISLAKDINYDYFVKKYLWLSTIDPYGDTVFNHLQIPFVVAELDELVREIKSEELRKKIDSLKDFFKKADYGRLIKFVGD